jgi:phosphate transport system permease protein
MTEIQLDRRSVHERWRLLKDRAASLGMGIGGVSVIAAIALIFFYLLYVVLPLFMPADIEQVARYPIPGGNQDHTVYLALEEQNEIGARLTDAGRIVFFKTADGNVIDEQRLPVTPSAITSWAPGDKAGAVLAYGLADGSAVAFRAVYKTSFPNNVRKITPTLEYPLGEASLTVDAQGAALDYLALQSNDDGATFAAITADQRVVLTHYSRETSFLSDEVTLERDSTEIPGKGLPDGLQYILLDKEQRNLYLASADGQLVHFDITDKTEPVLVQRLSLLPAGRRLTQLRFLSGDISLLVGASDGSISQWFNVKDAANNPVLTRVRGFTDQETAIRDISAEYFRKGFIAVDSSGGIAIYHTTAERHLLTEETGRSIRLAAISPRASALLTLDDRQQVRFWHVDNDYPEVSWSALWGKVWYESYQEPDYIWQSSSASNDFEPKFSLTPLAFGTFKAAFYAMLFAMPLAIMGAIYTAYFMDARMRQWVKPGIEIMEALPTVILGFLAGLWLAPFMEANLPGVFSMLIFLPLGTLLMAYAWQYMPAPLRHRFNDGWLVVVLIPLIILLGWFAIAISHPLEILLFGGDMRHWIETELGMNFDQRNSLVVGLAMGFAVIPTIFSMTEDAIFSVPAHLRNGSLALGASQWQTLAKVVLLTASPGIFAAIMIGLGRAVGETMIVLMATGNTAILDFSMFEGMRTLSANIAVEMPESEVGSTHYRVLFLAALVLFIFTFFFNTIGEMVRHRLRKKYSSL